jgi:3-keto-disaccharide hydrolase
MFRTYVATAFGMLLFAATACPSSGADPAATTTAPASLFDGKSLDSWAQIPADSWVVKDGAMSSLGKGRGVIYTDDDFARYRLTFTMRHVGAEKGRDHQACFLIFCTRPVAGEKPLDALGGIQFQPPNGGHWDYRPGHNNGGNDLFHRLGKPSFDPHQWSRVEILVDAAKGTARMAVAQPVDSQAVEVLRFHDPTAGKTGPIAWQMHNQGLYDEFKDVQIEINPQIDELITTQ